MKKILILLITLIIASGTALKSQQKVWSLEECIIYAIENNIQIKQQAIQTEFNKNSLDLAKLKLLPTVNGQSSYSFSFNRTLDQTTNPIGIRTGRTPSSILAEVCLFSLDYKTCIPLKASVSASCKRTGSSGNKR